MPVWEYVGLCKCVRVVLWWAICLCKVEKMVVNAAGICIGSERFKSNGKSGVIGNYEPFLIDGGCEWFVYVWEGSDNVEKVCLFIWCPLRWQVTACVDEGFFMFLMIRCSRYAGASRIRVRLLNLFWMMWSSKCLWINDTFFTAEWVVGLEMK